MITVRRTIEIEAPVERVYQFVHDPNNLPEIWPSMVEVSNVEEDGDRVSFDWVYKMLGRKFRGRAEMVDVERNVREVSKNERGIRSTITHLYEPLDGGTRFTSEVEYEIPDDLLSRLAEPIIRRLNEHEAEIFVNNLKDRMELEEAHRAAEEEAPAAGLGTTEARPPAP